MESCARMDAKDPGGGAPLGAPGVESCERIEAKEPSEPDPLVTPKAPVAPGAKPATVPDALNGPMAVVRGRARVAELMGSPPHAAARIR